MSRFDLQYCMVISLLEIHTGYHHLKLILSINIELDNAKGGSYGPKLLGRRVAVFLPVKCPYKPVYVRIPASRILA